MIDPASYITIVEVKVNLKVSDIGRDWVYLTWNESAGDLICNNETYLNSNEMNDKTSMNISFNILEPGISYNCSIGNDFISNFREPRVYTRFMVLRNNRVNFILGKKDQLCTIPRYTNKHSR